MLALETVWANEFDSKIWQTFETNFPDVELDRRDIRELTQREIPDDIDGVIGGPPCQSWSEAGALRGIDDHRGKLFYDYIDVIKNKRPLFFLVENVSGILSSRNKRAFCEFLDCFRSIGYDLAWKLLNAHDFDVAQDRRRVFVVGYRDDLRRRYRFPLVDLPKRTLRDVMVTSHHRCRDLTAINRTSV